MPDTRKRRWRPRFSVRTFLILLTLLCAYAACWLPTKTQGVEDIGNHLGFRGYASEAFAPLVVSCNELKAVGLKPNAVEVGYRYQRHYYFWFFGYVAKLPYESQLKNPPPRRDPMPTQRGGVM